MLKYQVDVPTDGKVIFEVLDRVNTACGEIKQVTSAVGVEESDEHLPDEDDKVNEVSLD